MDLSDSGEVLYLHRESDGSVVQSRSSGSSQTFTVAAPSSGYERYYASVGNVVSKTVSVNNPSSEWEVTLTPVISSFLAGGLSSNPSVSIGFNKKLNAQSYYGVYVVNDDTGAIVYKSKSLSTLSYTLSIAKFFDANSKSFSAYIAYYDSAIANFNEMTDIVAASDSTELFWTPFNISASVTNGVFTTDGASPIIDFTTNQNIYAAGKYYYVVDETTGVILTKNQGSSSGSVVNYSVTLPKFYSGDEHFYSVYIADNSAAVGEDISSISGIQAISNSISTGRASWTIDAYISADEFATQDSSPQVFATSNQKVYNSNGAYAWYLVDETLGQIISTSDGKYGNYSYSPSISRFYTGGPHIYSMYIAAAGSVVGDSPDDLLDVQAISPTMTVQRAAWDLTTSITANIFGTGDLTPEITGTANQKVYSTNGNYSWYLVDETTGEILSVYSGDAYNAYTLERSISRFYTGGAHIYRMYIAASGASAGQPKSSMQDVQAVSNALQVSRQEWNLDTEVTGVTYVENDEYNYADDEIFETLYTYAYGQSVYQTNDAYTLYLIGNGEVVNLTNGSSKHSGRYTLDGMLHSRWENVSYYTVVAARGAAVGTPASALDDVQARSDVWNSLTELEDVSVRELKMGYNPSTGECNLQCYGDPVNSLNGEFFDTSTDISAISPIALGFTRSYSSLDADNLGPLGYGWTADAFIHAEGDGTSNNVSDSSTVTIVQENSSIVNFVKSPDTEAFLSAGRVNASLTENADGNLVFERTNGISYIFDGSTGEVLEASDRNGNTLSYAYTAGKLTSITSSNGNSITINWNGALVSSVATQGESVSYTYNGNELVSVSYSQIGNNEAYTYDVNHRILTVKNTDNGVFTNVYDSHGRVVKQTDPQGNITTFAYSSASESKTTTITTPNGNVTKENFNKANQLTSRVEAYGTSLARTTTYAYDTNGHIGHITDAGGYNTYYTYDGNGNPTEITDAEGNTTLITYDDNNMILSVELSSGATLSYTYDSKGNMLTETSPEGNTTSYSYNSEGLKTSIISPSQYDAETPQPTIISYDTNGLPGSIISPSGKNISIEYGSNYKVTSATSVNGVETLYTYDSYNRLSGYEFAEGTSSAITYNAAGRLSSETDKMGNTTTYSYNNLGQIYSITDTSGTTSYIYDSMQNITSITTPDGLAEQYTYDLLGRPTTKTDIYGNVTLYTYDIRDNVLTVTDALNNVTSYVYDSLNQVIQTTAPDGGVTTYSYDLNGRLVSSTDALNRTTSYVYDNDDNITQITYPDSSQNFYSYNADGDVIEFVDSAGEHKTYSYDNEGNVISIEEKDGSQTSINYDLNGQISNITKPDGTEIVYEYNQYGQLWKTSHDNWAVTDEIYTYDQYGRVISIETPTEITEYEYDQLGNILRRGPPTSDGGSYIYEYDSLSRLISVTDPNGNITEYEYNQYSQPTSTIVNGDTIAENHYDSYGRSSALSYANGITTNFTYDTYSRYSGRSIINEATNATIYQEMTEYDIAGYITSETVSSLDTSLTSLEETETLYTYDALGRLDTAAITAPTSQQTATQHDYSYDSQNNILTDRNSSYTYDNVMGRVSELVDTTTSASTDFTYNTAGSRSSSSENSTEDTNTTATDVAYGYDYAQQLISWDETAVTENNTNISDYQYSSTSIDYQYDSSGLLTNKTAQSYNETVPYGNEPSNQNVSVVSNTYSWDVNNSVPRLTSDGNNTYYYQLGTYIPIMQVNNTTGTVTYLHLNDLGSVIATSDETGAIQSVYHYDEYGNTLSNSSDTTHAVTQFAYAGQYIDTDTGLYYMRARWYDPTTASFISIDPALELTDSPYAYADGNPISFTDPLGLMSNWEGIWAWASDNPAEVTIGAVGFIGGVACGIATAGGCVVGGAIIAGVSSAAAYSVSTPCATISGAVAAGFIGSLPVPGGALVGKTIQKIGQSSVFKSVPVDKIIRTLRSEEGYACPICLIKVKKSHATLNGDGTYDLHFYYKRGWDGSQIADADSKILAYNKAASKGELKNTKNYNRDPSIVAGYRADNAAIKPPGKPDVDHIIDLKLGGKDSYSNLTWFDLSVNRSFGSQVGRTTNALPNGAIIRSVTIGYR